jgi:hypothetical protein
MWFHQAAGKLSKDNAEVYNNTSGLWEPLGFKVLLSESGRWVGRTESFANRRVLLSPQKIDDSIQVLRLTTDNVEFLLYSEQPNIAKNKSYLFDYTIMNVEVGYAELFELVDTPMASGLSGRKVENSLGLFPIATDRFAGQAGSVVRDMNQSRLNCFIPLYCNAKREHFLRWQGYDYDIKEVYPELRILHLIVTQR